MGGGVPSLLDWGLSCPIERLVPAASAAAAETTMNEIQAGAKKAPEDVGTKERRADDEEGKHEEQEEWPDYKSQVNPGPDRHRRRVAEPRARRDDDDIVGKEPTDGPPSSPGVQQEQSVAVPQGDERPNEQGVVEDSVHGFLPERNDEPSQEEATVILGRREESILPVAYPVTSSLEAAQRNRHNQLNQMTLILLCLCIVAVIGAALGGVCGSGRCSSNSAEYSGQMPAPSPHTNGTRFRSFTDTEELYEAVDIYLLAEDAESSFISSRYGYPIGTWDVSQIKNFSRVFAPVRVSRYDILRPPSNFNDFNENVSAWNVSAAETMYGIFYGCRSFDQDISSWDVQKVRDFAYMLSYASSFNGDLSSWDVSKAETMYGTFASASLFNSNLSRWEVGSVTDFGFMFSNTSFNSHGDLSLWNVSKAEIMCGMFAGASFNGNVSSWDVGNVKDFTGMFYNAFNFNSNLSAWNVSKAKTMQSMFDGAALFNSNLSHWDVRNVNDFAFMFSQASVFNSDLSVWNVSNAETMVQMFDRAASFNSNLSLWDVGNVRDFAFMFSEASIFDNDLSLWLVSKAESMQGLFDRALAFSSDISAWDVGNVKDFSYMFFGAFSFSQNLCSWGTRIQNNVTVTEMFSFSACPYTDEPDTSLLEGPWCFDCFI
jgi:hypothetical protein